MGSIKWKRCAVATVGTRRGHLAVVSNIWKTHVQPYFLRRDCFRKRDRIETWLRANDGAIQICPLDLSLAEPNENCNGIKASSYVYLTAFKTTPAHWQDQLIYYQLTAAILDLGRFSDFDDYQRAVSRSSHGNDNRSVKKAQRLGYRTRIIDGSAHQASIDRIRRSKIIRTGGLMLEAVLPRATLTGKSVCVPIRAPQFKVHWSICWGVFKDETLVAYALLTRCGDLIRTIHIMGHRNALRDGVVKLLVFDIIRSLFEGQSGVFSGIRYFMYGALEHGGRGLFEWKLRLQFRPSLVDLSLVQAEYLPPGFDEATYLDLNPDVRKARVDGRMHYMVWGKREGRRYN